MATARKEILHTSVNIGIEIQLQKLITSRMLIQGSSGSGKSHMIRLMNEMISPTGIQQIIIDSEGEFVTLREKFDYVLVAKNGDIPISIRHAEVIAHKLLELSSSAIIDLSDFGPDDKEQFVYLFFKSVLKLPRTLWHPCIFYIDEAHKYCPEGIKTDSARVIAELCSTGRKRTFCPILATQRISKLNKDAAAELGNKMIGFCNQDLDLRRAADELGFPGKTGWKKIKELDNEFFAFGPALNKNIIQFKANQTLTKEIPVEKLKNYVVPTPDAVKKIMGLLKTIPDDAEKELTTVAELTAEINRLKLELSQVEKLPAENTGSDDHTEAEAIEELEGLLKLSRQYNNTLREQLIEYHGMATKANDKLRTIDAQISAIHPVKIDEIPEIDPDLLQNDNYDPQTIDRVKRHLTHHAEISNKPAKYEGPATGQPIVKTSAPVNNGSLTTGEFNVISAIAQFSTGITREHITVLTGYKRSSRDTYLQKLKQKGLVQQNGELLSVVIAETKKLALVFQKLPTGKALQAHHLSNLPTGEGNVLREIIAVYPKSIHRDEITERTKYLRSSRDTYLQKLVTRKLIILTGKGMVQAAPELF